MAYDKILKILTEITIYKINTLSKPLKFTF